MINNLFSDKELYLLSRTLRGKLLEQRKDVLKRRIPMSENLHLIDRINFTNSGYPIVPPYNGPTDCDFYSFKEYKKHGAGKDALMFFMYDCYFEKRLWDNLEAMTFKFRNYSILVAPDYSLYVDVPKLLNERAVYKSRFIAAYWAHCGFSVIPTASWGDAFSLEYSLESLPEHSVVAVCGTGVNRNEMTQALWLYGLRKLEEEKCPTKILVYGEERDVPGIHTEIVFIKDYITKHFRR